MKTKPYYHLPLSFFKEILSFILAATVSLSTFYLAHGNFLIDLEKTFTNINMVLFIVSIFLFCIVFLISYLSLQKLTPHFFSKNHVLSKLNSNLITILTFLLFSGLFWIVFINAKKILAYRSMEPFSKMHIALMVFINFLIIILRKFLFEKFKMFNCKIIWMIAAFLTAGIVSLFFYAPNSLQYRNDYDAYYNSIYIHQQDIPFSENFTSIYGHYAIFFRLILKFIHVNPYTIAGITAFIGFVSLLCIIYTLYNIIKNPILRLLGLATLIFPFSGFFPIIYPQTYPNRLFFPSILMALGIYLTKNTNYRRKLILIIGYIISSLSIVWNNDTGIVCLIAWGALHTYILFTKNRFKLIHILRFFIPIFFIFTVFFITWKAVDIYNIALGGKTISLYYFLYPILETRYMDIIRTNIPLFFSYWMVALLLFFIFLGRGITSMSFCVKKVNFNDKIAMGILISVLGIGQLMYFMNRTVYYNLLLCYYQVILLFLFISESSKNALLVKKKNILESIHTGTFYFSISILIVLFIKSLVTIDSKIAFMITFTSMDSLNEMTAYIKNTVQKDTPIISVDTPTLGIALGWKNEIGFLDLTDLFLKHNEDFIINKIVNYNKPLLVEKLYYDRFVAVQELPEFNNSKKIKDIYNSQELTEMSNIWFKYFGTSYNKSVLVYLTPKKTL